MMDEEEKDGTNTDTESESEETESGSQEERESSTKKDESSKGDKDLALLRSQLAAANSEAAKYRKERNALKADLDKKSDAELSELEKEKKRADESDTKVSMAMGKVQKANLRIALSTSDVGIVDIDTAAMWLRERGVEFDDDGEPVEADKAIKALIKDKPFLAGKTPAPKKGSNNSGEGNSDDESSGGLTADELMIAKSFKMSPSDYAKWKDKNATVPEKASK